MLVAQVSCPRVLRDPSKGHFHLSIRTLYRAGSSKIAHHPKSLATTKHFAATKSPVAAPFNTMGKEKGETLPNLDSNTQSDNKHNKDSLLIETLFAITIFSLSRTSSPLPPPSLTPHSTCISQFT